MRLSPRQIALLRECAAYAIADQHWCKLYYRLGGYGCVPLRYHRDTMRNLVKLGLVTDGSVSRATDQGRAALAALDQAALPATSIPQP